MGERVAALSAASQRRLADDIRAVEARIVEVPPEWRPSGVDAPLTRRAITPSMAQVAEEVAPPERVAPEREARAASEEAPTAPETVLREAAWPGSEEDLRTISEILGALWSPRLGEEAPAPSTRVWSGSVFSLGLGVGDGFESVGGPPAASELQRRRLRAPSRRSSRRESSASRGAERSGQGLEGPLKKRPRRNEVLARLSGLPSVGRAEPSAPSGGLSAAPAAAGLSAPPSHQVPAPAG